MDHNAQTEQMLRQKVRVCVRKLFQKMCMLRAIEENLAMPNREQKLVTYRRHINRLEAELSNTLALRDLYLVRMGRPIYDFDTSED